MNNENQIIRKGAKNCFVESLNDTYGIGKIHLNFAAYNMDRPEGKRQTDSVHIYLAADEFLELCRKLCCGELRYMIQMKKKNGDKTPIYQSLGGTQAEKLKRMDRARSDGMSLSRTFQIYAGVKTDFLLVAESGPGAVTEKGLIVPKFGNKPENHVTIAMTFENFSGLLLCTKEHYSAWLTAQYLSAPKVQQLKKNKQKDVEEEFFSMF